MSGAGRILAEQIGRGLHVYYYAPRCVGMGPTDCILQKLLN